MRRLGERRGCDLAGGDGDATGGIAGCPGAWRRGSGPCWELSEDWTSVPNAMASTLRKACVSGFTEVTAPLLLN